MQESAFITPSFIHRFCLRCKKQRNMLLYGSGADHVSAKCVHCGREYVFSFDPVTGEISGLIGQLKHFKPKPKSKDDRSVV